MMIFSNTEKIEEDLLIFNNLLKLQKKDKKKNASIFVILTLFYTEFKYLLLILKYIWFLYRTFSLGYFPQHCLYFFPLLHAHGLFLPIFVVFLGVLFIFSLPSLAFPLIVCFLSTF